MTVRLSSTSCQIALYPVRLVAVTDKADALGTANMMRAGWFRQASIKSESCYRKGLLLTHRRNLNAEFLDLENVLPERWVTVHSG